MVRLALVLLFIVCATAQPLVNWRVQNSQKVSASPEQISAVGFDDRSWYGATVPANGTVMAVLLQNNVYENITFGMNLNNVPTSQFESPWWYRTEFPVPKSELATLTFKGINYRANLWLNGYQIGNASTVVGTFRHFTFDITAHVSPSGSNALAVEIYRPHDGEEDAYNVTGTDLAITFVDWSVPPPDGNMGLWQEVILSTSGPVTIQYPLVETTLLSDELADLTVMAELSNFGPTPASGMLVANISGLGICSQKVSLAVGTSQVFFTSTTCPMLSVKNPTLWWPSQMGTPYLYTLTLQFTSTSGANNTLVTPFGIRQVTSELDSRGHRLYKVNGKNILIRGAGWAPDLFQRTTPERQEIEMQYVQHLNLNTIRLEGKFENDNLFNLADQYGVLMMPGICCCDAWQNWTAWDKENYIVAQESIRSQAKRLRIHPSILVFIYSSDDLPPTDVEKLYLTVFASEFWPNPLLASASEYTSNLTGPTGVKMSGPYSWVSPNYWLLDTHTVGGAFGFLTEGGPGESPLTWDSFTQTFPPEHYWPIDEVWDYHCGAWYGNFHSLDYFTAPLNIRYGQSQGAMDYIEKSQLAAYEGQRAMFEAYSRNKYVSTGVIQWMLNNAFTEMIWHLYDSYLVQGGGYYGSKKACEPVHIMYSYNDNSIWVINSLYEGVPTLQARASVFNIDGVTMFNQSYPVDALDADSAKQIFVLPALKGLTSTYFLRLALINGNDELLSDNFYWLSTAQDVPEFSKSTWFNTPCSKHRP